MAPRTSPAPAPLAEGEEPTAEFVAAYFGLPPHEADWVLILYRFHLGDPDAASRPPFYCEAL